MWFSWKMFGVLFVFVEHMNGRNLSDYRDL
jgi:hypothetical protein